MQSPVSPAQAYSEAASSDAITINHWRGTWLRNIKANKEKFGSFAEKSAGLLFEAHLGQPALIAGSGPSLKRNCSKLKDRPKNMVLVSCLHNFHFMEDAEANVDYYVTLDAGPITVDEVTEGGSKEPSVYWEATRNRTLIAYIGTDPKLLEKWQGKIYFFNAAIPDEGFIQEVGAIEPFYLFIESGGCVLGSCLFFAKGFLGCNATVFVGADFSFSNSVKTAFHAWDSQYDKNIGSCIMAVDIFGNKVKTWLSYYNFKLWFEVVAQRIPGIYINCTEGGIFGSHRDGNIIHIKQMWIEDAFDMFSLQKHKKNQAETPEVLDKICYI